MRKEHLINAVVWATLSLVSVAALAGSVWADEPFAAESTTRESLKVTGRGAFPNPTPTYAQLEQDSKDLSIQVLDSGRMFLAFASKDGSVDNGGTNAAALDRCSSTSHYNVYWVDNSSGWPAECISINWAGTEVSEDADNPKIGGADGDEGRYVAFQSAANNLVPPTPTPEGTPTVVPTPADVQQIYIHDRKWNETWLSQAQDCYSSWGYPDGDSWVNMLTDDGKTILLTSKADNIIDNLNPTCGDADGYGKKDIFTRDGGVCKDPGLGECKTSVVYDEYDYHAGANTVSILWDADSENAHMTQDGSVLVFQTMSIKPQHFLSDTLNNWDIYSWVTAQKRFTRLSESQVAVVNSVTQEVSVQNIGGPANGDSKNPKVDETGNLVVFDSDSTDLVLEESGGTYSYKGTNSKKQIYLYDRRTQQTEMLSTTPSGVAGNGDSEHPFISRDGRFIVFESEATDLLSGVTTTGYKNIFVRDRTLETTFLVTPGPNPSYPAADTRTTRGLNADAVITDVAPNGLIVAFQTAASNAINDTIAVGGADDNGKQDVFIASNTCPTDSDGDKTPDCLDECNADPNKNAAGICGCNVAETDSDSDGSPDCVDECPRDASKTSAGQCGCATEDTDADSDGTADCVDGCKYDAAKTAPGQCGCGVSDADANGNGNADCIDPSADLTPAAPAVKRLKVKAPIKPRLRVTARSQYPNANVTYEFELAKVGGTTRKINSTKTVAVFRNLSRGRYRVKYRITAGTVSTQWSAEVAARIS